MRNQKSIRYLQILLIKNPIAKFYCIYKNVIAIMLNFLIHLCMNVDSYNIRKDVDDQKTPIYGSSSEKLVVRV